MNKKNTNKNTNKTPKRKAATPREKQIPKMHRVIKFRVWDSKNKRFLKSTNKIKITLDGKPTYKQRYSSPVKTDWVPQQFTGLKDRRGREIYEGDIILQAWKSEFGNMEHKYSVRFGEYVDVQARGNIGFYTSCMTQLTNQTLEAGGNLFTQEKNTREVIGNIFENPNLLESENK
jgi:uncharacterized phage protein (TIGR01671 family)